MSLSVLEVLQNAEFNLSEGTSPMQKQIGIKQLRNAIKQLEDNSDADEDFKE